MLTLMARHSTEIILNRLLLLAGNIDVVHAMRKSNPAETLQGGIVAFDYAENFQTSA